MRTALFVLSACLLISCAAPRQPESPAPEADFERMDEEDPERYLPREEDRPAPNQLAYAARQAQARTQSRGAQIHDLREWLSEGQEERIFVSAESVWADGDPMRIHVLNIGAGSCQIVECPNSDDILVADCGSMNPTDNDMNREQIAAYLDSIGVSGKIMVTLSHPHEDHYNRIAALMGDRLASSIWLGGRYRGYGGDRGHPDDHAGDWLDRQEAAGIPIYSGFDRGFANRGLPVEQLSCGDAQTYILTVNVSGSPNANSMVLLVEYGNFRAIFSGDAEGKTEDSAMANFGALTRDVAVLTSSHHGASSHYSNDDDWAEHTRPQVVVFSSGVSHRHPRREAGSRYEPFVMSDVASHEMWWDPNRWGSTDTFKTRTALYSTEVSGVIIVETDGQEFWLSCHGDDDPLACF